MISALAVALHPGDQVDLTRNGRVVYYPTGRERRETGAGPAAASNVPQEYRERAAEPRDCMNSREST